MAVVQFRVLVRGFADSIEVGYGVALGWGLRGRLGPRL